METNILENSAKASLMTISLAFANALSEAGLQGVIVLCKSVVDHRSATPFSTRTEVPIAAPISAASGELAINDSLPFPRHSEDPGGAE